MPPLADAGIRRKILDAFSRSEGGDCVEWSRDAKEHLRELLPSFGWRRINQMLREGIVAGREILQVVETREDYRERHEFHYDFKIKIGNTKYYVYGWLLEERSFDPEFFVANFKLDSRT